MARFALPAWARPSHPIVRYERRHWQASAVWRVAGSVLWGGSLVFLLVPAACSILFTVTSTFQTPAELLDVGSAPSKGGNPDHLNSPQEFDNAKLKAEQHLLSHVRPARQAIRLAAAEAAKIAKNEDKLFTQTTAKAAAKIEVSLLAYEKRLREIKLNDFDTRKLEKMETARQVLEIYEVSLLSALSNGDKFIQKVRETPTAAVFNDGIGGACRKLTQVIGNVNKIKSQGAQLAKEQPTALFEELPPWADKGVRLPKEATREAVLEAVNKYARIVGDIRNWWA